jgi:putative SOS response-associated peptidase YedK
MCGRFTITSGREVIASQLGLDAEEFAELVPRYTAAPSQRIPAVRLRADGKREVIGMKWGLVPAWAPTAVGLANARAETAAEKPSFRDAVRLRRCLVPADGFIEWETAVGKKRPHWFRLAGGEPFCFAAIWEPGIGSHPETVAILTVEASDDLRPFHDRMPAILHPGQFSAWLDGTLGAGELKPLAAGEIAHYPVSPKLNSPKLESPDLLRPVLSSLFD